MCDGWSTRLETTDHQLEEVWGGLQVQQVSNYLLVLSPWSVSEGMTMCKDQLKMESTISGCPIKASKQDSNQSALPAISHWTSCHTWLFYQWYHWYPNFQPKPRVIPPPWCCCSSSSPVHYNLSSSKSLCPRSTPSFQVPLPFQG